MGMIEYEGMRPRNTTKSDLSQPTGKVTKERQSNTRKGEISDYTWQEKEDAMEQAKVGPKIEPIDVVRPKKQTKKSKRWFWRLNKFITKSVNYYEDEEFQKTGLPLRWID